MALLKKPRNKKSNFTEMRQAGKKHTLVWCSWVDGEQLITQWGVLDGQLQQTIDVPGPKGKADTKAWISPEQSALNTLSREIKKRLKRGYKLETELGAQVKSILGDELDEVQASDSFDFSGPLPQNLCFSKPVNSIDPKRLEKLSKSKSAYGSKIYWTVKVNGMMYVVSKDKRGDLWIQSRGKMIVSNDKYPHLVEQFDKILPQESIMLAEFYLGEGKSRRDFTRMQRLVTSLPDEAVRKQKEDGLAKAYVFRIPFWKGANTEFTTHNFYNLHTISDLTDGWDDKYWRDGRQRGFAEFEHLYGIEIYDDSYDEVIRELKEEKYEGYVVYQLDAPLGERAHSFQGKPDRPPVCWKYKPDLEDDFVAVWDPDGRPAHCSSKCQYKSHEDRQTSIYRGRCVICKKAMVPDGSWGTGKNRERVGSISLYQFDSNNVMQYICDCSGMADGVRDEMVNEPWPRTVRVIYKERSYISEGDDSNALFHPSFDSFRGDKAVSECVNGGL